MFREQGKNEPETSQEDTGPCPDGALFITGRTMISVHGRVMSTEAKVPRRVRTKRNPRPTHESRDGGPARRGKEEFC